MLHFRQNPADVKKAYPFAAVAKMEGIHFFYFSYKNVDFDNMKINGWMYEEGKWIQKQVDFPAVVINSCNPKTENQSKILKKLKKYVILTSFPVGNKMKVYKKVKKAKVVRLLFNPFHYTTQVRKTYFISKKSAESRNKTFIWKSWEKGVFYRKNGGTV